MDNVPHTLNALVRHRPMVYSLHQPDGQAVAVFAASDGPTIARQIEAWVPHFAAGCVGIVWKHGYPDQALGRCV